MGRPQGRPENFTVDQRVKFRPGNKTSGYAEDVGEDGTIAATVIGHSPTKVRIEFEIDNGVVRRRVKRSVWAKSLEPA